jgi:DNA polymerase III delta prime subunit
MPAIIIHGPSGSGKTTHAKALAEHYGKAFIVDDFVPHSSIWKRAIDMPADALFITSYPVDLDGPGKASFVHIADACRAAGLTPHPMLTKARHA